MRKYLKILVGFLILLKEELLNGFRIKLHGILYCVNTGVKILTDRKSRCDLGTKTWISENCIFECASGGQISMGYNNFFNTNCRITALDSIEIGDNNLFGPNLVIVDHDHNYADKEELICRQGFNKAPVKIGSNVWIGANVTICKGVTVGDGVIIGANSFVSNDLTEKAVYAGIPAKKLKDI